MPMIGAAMLQPMTDVQRKRYVMPRRGADSQSGTSELPFPTQIQTAHRWMPVPGDAGGVPMVAYT
jgi:hypothetical protein